MHFVYFTHALTSCWNHGNAHFQRGVLRALLNSGHNVCAWEPEQSWSRANLLSDQGELAAAAFQEQFSDIPLRRYNGTSGLDEAVQNADVVIVHEWTDPGVVAELGRLRRTGSFTLLFHDTHHRVVSDTEAMRAFDLSEYDAILAFGATLARVYEGWGWRGRVFVWHEAADTSLFQPPHLLTPRKGAVWIGNWGDGERTGELQALLLRPSAAAGVTLDVYGVRYPEEARMMLQSAGASYHGWVANARVPAVFARHAMTVHVPRSFYTTHLPGIPTIRVFEALACGIPLICAPWDDTEGLFRPGDDYLVARDGREMAHHMSSLAHDEALGAALSASGLARVRARHSCAVRALELLDILAAIARPPKAAKGVAR